MKRFFLIDFENVADAGLNGFFELTAEDTVDLFYTQKNNRISIDFFKTFLDRRSLAELRLRKVATGNQAPDLQLASFLGSLIAGGDGPCEYCIISKDKGFGCLPSFWENQKGCGLVRQAGSIREALGDRPTAPAAEPAQPAEPEPAKPRPEPQKPKPEPEKPLPLPEPEKPLSLPEKAAPAPEPEKPKTASQPNEKTVLNVKVQQALSKAKMDTQIINQTASLIAKAFGDPKIKQTVYRALIKRHGQKLGLEVYNLVKPFLK